MKELDLFGEEIITKNPKRVNVYADEIQELFDQITGESWMYIGTTFEIIEKPILPLLVEQRYLKNMPRWEEYREKNDRVVHWAEIRSADQKNICERWLKNTYVDNRFYFSIFGINLKNLNITEFGDKNNFNVIYNRFFRTNLAFSLKKFFGKGVIVENIYHEHGQQEYSEYFDWHTIFRLDQDEHLNFKCSNIIFLPKNHKEDERSNVIQLTDVYLGIFKDLHLGLSQEVRCGKSFKCHKKFLLEFIEPLFKRVIEKPDNINSSYKYARRINISLFPKTKSGKGDLERIMNNFYNPKEISLSYHLQDSPQISLF